MDRPLLSLALSSLLFVPAVACKKGENEKPKAEAKPAEQVIPEETKPAPEPEQGPVKADLALIDKSLNALADATLAKAGKDDAGKGLPPITGEIGLSCGSDGPVSDAVAHIGYDIASLKAGAGFRFADVCVGWRPYIKPRTEMFWMISAGEESKESGMLEHRRCIRVRVVDGALSKDAIIDGPCLEMHRRERAAAEADKGDEDVVAGDKVLEKKSPAKKADAPSK